jgi:hypothetical protein
VYTSNSATDGLKEVADTGFNLRTIWECPSTTFLDTARREAYLRSAETPDDALNVQRLHAFLQAPSLGGQEFNRTSCTVKRTFSTLVPTDIAGIWDLLQEGSDLTDADKTQLVADYEVFRDIAGTFENMGVLYSDRTTLLLSKESSFDSARYNAEEAALLAKECCLSTCDTEYLECSADGDGSLQTICSSDTIALGISESHASCPSDCLTRYYACRERNDACLPVPEYTSTNECVPAIDVKTGGFASVNGTGIFDEVYLGWDALLEWRQTTECQQLGRKLTLFDPF